VKILKRKPHSKWNPDPRKGNSHTLPPVINCRPNRKRETLQVHSTLLPHRRKKVCLLPRQQPSQQEATTLPAPSLSFLILDCNSLLFLNKPIFAGKTTSRVFFVVIKIIQLMRENLGTIGKDKKDNLNLHLHYLENHH